ncbi:hypothetical protein ATK36_5489 [Amycolatopsis sulphurea]|uniref:PH (Pleckstrin Homology) domain-containing protein n=1 Tax=Amycolatopsis sulphurea TaxID=76022 RepID=A0A2A9FFX3_9PSEU|nr:hypothetical protein ATK36_5489 [Amycolatopsis sulphurea]
MTDRTDAAGHRCTIVLNGGSITIQRISAPRKEIIIPLRDIVQVCTRAPHAWFKGEFEVHIRESEPMSIRFTRRQAREFYDLYATLKAQLSRID